MSAWWNDNHARLGEERAAIEKLGSDKDWLENIEWGFDDDIRMSVMFDLDLPHLTFSLRLTYPTAFPHSVPSVAPIEAERISSHQFGTRDLCLEIRPDNWHPEFTGADMIESAYALLKKEVPDEDGEVTPAPSAHDVPDEIDMRNAVSRLYIKESDVRALKAGIADRGEGEIWPQWCGESFVVGHIASASHGEWSWTNKALPYALGREGSRKPVLIYHCKLGAAAFGGVVRRTDLVEKLGQDPAPGASDFYCLILTGDDEAILYRQLDDVDGLIRYRTVPAPEDGDHRSGDLFERLTEKRVGIVGLGSVGSKIALSLARAGVGRFDLIDADVLHPGNLERHDGDWRDVGLHKADIVARRIRLVSPSVKLTPRRVFIGAQVSASEAGNVNGALRDCNLVIDATANSDVFNHVSGLCVTSGTDLVWGGVYAGGIGGYIARSREQRDPNPFVVRQALNEFYEGVIVAPPEATGGYGGADGEAPVFASDGDVGAIANAMTQFAIDTLLGDEPSPYQYPIYLIGLKPAWVFDGPFDVCPISVEASPRQSESGHSHDDAQRAFVDDILKKKIHEIARTAKDD